MIKRWILIGILLSFLISFGSFLSIVILTSPNEGFIFIMLFYISLFISLFSFLFLIIFLFDKITRREIGDLSVYFRHGLFLTSIIILTLIFQNLKILRWWNLIILFIIFLFIELFFYRKNEIYKKTI